MSPGNDRRRLLGEGVMIVLSILLAFAIQASWESRQETDLRTEALSSLRDELDLLELLLERSAENSRAVAEGAAYLLRAAAVPEQAEGDSVASALLKVQSGQTTDVSLTAYDLLVSSGSLDILGDDELTGHLVRLRTLMDVKDRNEAQEVAFLHGQLGPYLDRFGELPPPEEWYARWDVEVPDRTANSLDFGPMLRDPVLMNLVHRRTYHRVTVERLIREIRATVSSIRVAIDGAA